MLTENTKQQQSLLAMKRTKSNKIITCLHHFKTYTHKMHRIYYVLYRVV